MAKISRTCTSKQQFSKCVVRKRAKDDEEKVRVRLHVAKWGWGDLEKSHTDAPTNNEKRKAYQNDLISSGHLTGW